MQYAAAGRQQTSENVLPDISVINQSELENRQLKRLQE